MPRSRRATRRRCAARWNSTPGRCWRTAWRSGRSASGRRAPSSTWRRWKPWPSGPQERGDHGEAIRYLRRAEALDPLRDSLPRRLMTSLAAAGDPAAAIQTYRDFRHPPAGGAGRRAG